MKFEDFLSNADLLATNEKLGLLEALDNFNLIQSDQMELLSAICDDPRISVASFRWLFQFLREV